MRNDPLVACRAMGGAAAVLVAAGGLTAGAVPYTPQAGAARPGLVCVYIGLALLLLAWWQHGGVAATQRQTLGTLACWAAPLLVAPPMFSRDVYSYLAQGLMLHEGLDVYSSGPAGLGGPVAAQVPALWLHTPSPYGPVFLLAARAVTGVADTHLVAGVLGMRLVAVLGVGLLAWAVPGLARAAGIDPVRALWLTVLNPLVLIHLVAGAHNDALMVGLLAAGLAAAVAHRPVTAAALMAMAALVKAPAAAGLCAVALIWAARLPGRWPLARAALVVGVAAGAVTVVVTRISGTGYGWVAALSAPISPGNWAPAGLLGRWTAALMAVDDAGATAVVDVWRWAGVLGTLVVAALVWTYRDRLGVVHGLGIVFASLVVLGPAFRPWYLIWAVVPLAVAAPDRARRWTAVACAGLVPLVLPDGYAASGEQVLLALLGLLIGAAGYLAMTARATAAVLR